MIDLFSYKIQKDELKNLLINGICLPKRRTQDPEKEILYALTNGELVDQVDYLNVSNSAIIVTKNELKVLKKEDCSIGSSSANNNSAYNDDYLFSKPSGICFDNYNNLYICDSGNNRVKVLNSSLNLTKLIDFATNPQDRLSQPKSVCMEDDVLYVCDSGNHRIVTYHVLSEGADFKFRSIYGRGYGSEVGMLSYPLECCTDSNGIVCVRDHHNSRVQLFNREGEAFHVIEINPSREVIYSMTMSKSREVYVAKMINSSNEIDDVTNEPISKYYIDIY